MINQPRKGKDGKKGKPAAPLCDTLHALGAFAVDEAAFHKETQ